MKMYKYISNFNLLYRGCMDDISLSLKNISLRKYINWFFLWIENKTKFHWQFHYTEQFKEFLMARLFIFHVLIRHIGI